METITINNLDYDVEYIGYPDLTHDRKYDISTLEIRSITDYNGFDLDLTTKTQEEFALYIAEYLLGV